MRNDTNYVSKSYQLNTVDSMPMKSIEQQICKVCSKWIVELQQDRMNMLGAIDGAVRSTDRAAQTMDPSLAQTLIDWTARLMYFAHETTNYTITRPNSNTYSNLSGHSCAKSR